MSNGDKILLTETCQGETKYFGSTEVTCLTGTIFSFTRSPLCLTGGECAGFFPGWTFLETDTEFPVPTGTVVDLTCHEGLQISGSTQITCHNTTFYIYSDGEPLCSPEASDGWLKPLGDTKYNIDLRKSPLQIVTDTPSGTQRYLQIQFYTETELIGTLTVKFESHPWYEITYCEWSTVKFEKLPESPSKIWTIVISPESFTVYCNTVEVINIVYGDKEDDFCKEKWSLKSTQIRFPRHYVTTSHYYRQQPPESCIGLPSYWNSIVTTSAVFPVSNGDKISLTETCPQGSRFYGSTEVTCLTGTIFSFTRSPQCLAGGDCTGLYRGWNFLETDTEFPVPTGTVIDVTCYDGLQISGSTQITCYDGTIYLYNGEAPLCTPEEADGWLKPLGDTHYDMDLTKNSLQIVTNTPSGTQRYLQIQFYAETELIGTLTVKFESHPWYKITHCQTNSMRFKDLPESPNRVWMLVLTPESFTVYCNTVEVIDIVYGDKEDDFCKEKWSLKITRIRFPRDHVATSDFYRQLPVESCTGLPSYWSSIVSTSALFPVSNGDVISLTETCQGETKYFGSTEVTCLTGTIFSFTRSPQCLTGGECTGFFPGWTFLETETEFPIDIGTVVDLTCHEGLQISGSTQITCHNTTFYIYSDGDPLCSPEASDGWSKPQGNEHYDIDLTKSPLQIVTDTPSGIRRYLQVQFYTETELIGTLTVKFDSHPWYQITHCQPRSVKIQNLPLPLSKVWAIVVTEGSFIVYCNAVQVIYIVFSDNKDDICKEKWRQKITRIRFPRDHFSTADYYRQQPVEGCTGLPSYWSSVVTTSAEFPVSNGDVISLTETCSDGNRFYGSTEITCLAGKTLSFTRSPQCLTGGECTGLYPGWNYLETDTKFPVPFGTLIDVTCYNHLEMSGSAQITCLSGFYFTQNEAPTCSASEGLDWSKPVHNVLFTVNLLESRLLILTNTPTATNRHMHLKFYRSNQFLGDFYVKFAAAPSYRVTTCHSKYSSFSNLPAEVSKLWSFSLSSGSLVLQCNGIKVMEVSLEKCGESWSDGLDSVLFGSYDTVSDYFKLHLEAGKCVQKY